MEKTIKEWLEELPDGYRERALANCDGPDAFEKELRLAILGAFDWEASKEGHVFWREVYEFYRPQKTPQLPPLPSEDE